MRAAAFCVVRQILRSSRIRRKSSKVPEACQWKAVDKKTLPKVPDIDQSMITHLERLSLVEFNNEAGVERLKQAVEYANQLYMVDTEGVEPMDSVLEDRELYLRPDQVTEGNCRQEVLQNAKISEEEYFVAPPGNVPLKSKVKEFMKKPDHSGVK